MKKRMLFAVLLGAGAAPAVAQTERITYQLSWIDSPLGNGNGVLEPGEGATIRVGVSFMPPVGTLVPYTAPAPGGNGTVSGLGSVRFDLVSGDCLSNSGGWTQIEPREGWALGSAGSPQPNGEVLDCEVGQAPPPRFPANPLNPVTEIWRGIWIPASYEARDVVFEVRPAQAAGAEHAALLIKYDEDRNGRPVYTTNRAQADPVLLHLNPLLPSGCACYANCDGSTGTPALNVNDFVCFQTRFAAGESYADCDQSGGLNVNDFVCFQAAFAAGCR